MNKGEFISLLNAPHDIDKRFIPELQNVINDYPFFQSAQLLLTKAFHHSENLNFENSLKKTAAYAANRKQLHSLLFDSIVLETVDETEPNHTPVKKIDKAVSNETQPSAPKEAIPLTEIEISSEKRELPIKQEITSNLPSSDIEENTAARLTIESEEKPEDHLERQIISSAISSSILLEVSDDIPELDDLPSVASKDKGDFSTTINDQIQETDNDRSFSDWIKHFGDDLQAEEFTQTQQKPTFINIPQQKVEFYSASKMAKLSVQEDDDLVTETLANIYADQGNFDKAIKAFTKLQLKYPEKRVYFAGRIKEIQNQINS